MTGIKKLFMIIGGTLLSTGLLAVPNVSAQEPPPPPQGDMPGGPGGPGPGFGERIEILGFGGMRGGKVVTGAPFSAVATTESTQTLADGNKIVRKTQANLFRDSQGRFRKDVSLTAVGPLSTQGQPRTFTVIQDPVAATTYVLNPADKTARAMPQRNRGAKNKFKFRHDAQADANGQNGEFLFRQDSQGQANVQRESLGTQTIGGVNAEGTRYTRTIPAGQIGNDKPISIVSETWYSADLQMVVMSKRSDPRFGETTYTLTNIQRTEPPANVFMVPSDYTVKQGRAMKFMKKGTMPPPPAPDAAGPGL